MRARISLITTALILAMMAGAFGQDWGPMMVISFNIIPPPAVIGIFNPTYCESDSLLYFDNCIQLGQPDLDAQMYCSKLDSIVNDYWFWSDPIVLPSPLNIPGSISIMPSINWSGDTLIFCSNRLGSRGGMDIWISVKFNGIWNEPENLGDSINTIGDEFKPYFSSLNQKLFFERMINGNNTQIWQADYIDSWRNVIRLPDIINVSGTITRGTYFNTTESALYFTNIDPQALQHNLKKSIYLNNEWQTPLTLSDNINGFWIPNSCNRVTTENAFISQSGQLMFYNKWIWEASNCIDMFSYLFISKKVSFVNDSLNNSKDNTKIIIFPNPTNGIFLFRFPLDLLIEHITIYNIIGQKVKDIYVDKNYHNISWDCKNNEGIQLPSGIYFSLFTNKGYYHYCPNIS